MTREESKKGQDAFYENFKKLIESCKELQYGQDRLWVIDKKH